MIIRIVFLLLITLAMGACDQGADSVSTDQSNSKPVTADRVTPDRVAPDRVTPATATPNQAMPEIIKMETTLGTISIELLPNQAPASVANFLTYIEQGYYEGTIFHRVIPGFMIQGGGFTEQLQRKSTLPPISNESAHTSGNSRGTVAFARTTEPDSATSQFFINVVDNAFLNHQPNRPGYAVFGQVIAGMAVVDQIAAVSTIQHPQFANLPRTAVVIKSVRKAEPAAQ